MLLSRVDDARPQPSRRTQAVRHSAAVTMLTVAIYRGYGLLQIVQVTVFGDPRHVTSRPLVAFTVAVLVQGLVVLAICVWQRRVPAAVITVDLALNVVWLFVGARLTDPQYTHTWVYFMYPYTMISCVAIGVVYRRLSTVVAATVVLAGAYVSAATLFHHDPWWNAVPNAISYFANTTIGWVLTRYLYRNGRQLDDSHDRAVAAADALARARERERHARLLHDRVLQTLESLVRNGWLADEQLRRQVAAEATWLRGLVEGVDTDHDLAAGLHRLVEHKAAMGLVVELNLAGLTGSYEWRSRLSRDAGSALVDAAFEALTNVSKHAGVGRAVLRATVRDDVVTVTVLDHGCGFDTSLTRIGTGLTRSIACRLREVGGTSQVESFPGSGTYVELTVPLAARASDPGRTAAALLPDGLPPGR